MSDFLDLGSLSADADVSAPQSEPSADTPIETSQTDEVSTGTEIKELEIVEELSSLKDEMSEAEVKALADDPRTPAPLRERLNKGLQYAEKFKAEKTELETRFNEVNEKVQAYEGKEVLPQADIERYKQAEERLMDIQSFSATPDTIDKFLKEANPTVYKQYQNQVVWQSLYDDNGKPDLDNWQAIVDKGLGWNGEGERVLAEDVLKVAEALRDGSMSKEDLDLYVGDAEANAHRRQMQTEQQQIKADREFQETQIRTHEIGVIKNQLQSEILPSIQERLETFKLVPLPTDPKPIAEYKQRILGRVSAEISKLSTEIRPLQEIQSAIDIISKPRGLTAKDAVAEVRGLIENPAYQRHVASGKSELLNRVDKILAQEALDYKHKVMGMELENSKAEKARTVISNPNQTANLPNLTAEQIAAMSGRERNQTAAERFTNQIRGMNEERRLG